MAFIFVPNGDGGFTEGDKQTNPDTGVEYIYDSGAWRALGPKIEDEFDTLDERYATNEYVDDGDQSVKDYADAGDQSVKDYVDDAVAAIPGTDLSSYLKNDGNNDLPAGANWKIRQLTSTGSNKTLIQGVDGQLGLYNLKEPNEAHHAATRGYVDAMGGGPKPAQLSWVFDGIKNSTTSAPPDGKFYKNGDYLRFSFKTHNGVDLSYGLADDTGVVETMFGPIGVVWYYKAEANSWRMKRQFRTDSWRWNYNNHFEFKLSSSKGHAWSSFTEGITYYITIGGWF